MIKKLVDRLTEALSTTETTDVGGESREAAIRMATAVLMTEIARADHDYDGSEFDLLLQLITRHFHMSPEDAVELANAANETAEEQLSLHSFTQLLNKNLSEQEKERIVLLLWQIAYADGRLDKYEDSMVSKIAGLLYVRRVRVMRLKHDVSTT